MDPQWRTERLPELVRALASRPRHEALRGHMTELLRSGFDAPYDEIAHEVYLLDGSGRMDTLWGATVIELKSDLRRELPDVLARLPDYLADAAARSRSPRPVTGLATDVATFIAYALREGALAELARYATDPARPAELVAWLEPLLTDRPDLMPEPRAVVQAFGRMSLTFSRARLQLDALWPPGSKQGFREEAEDAAGPERDPFPCRPRRHGSAMRHLVRNELFGNLALGRGGA
jgi:hypothetical protein